MATFLGWLLAILAIGGIGSTLHSTLAVARFARRRVAAGPAEPVSLLKPLHGLEPRLAENLGSFLDQDWNAPIQMVAGVQRADDPAIAVVESLGGSHDERITVDLVRDGTRHGANAKVANLINMAPTAWADLLVLSDADMAVPRDYLASLVGALAAPGVGAVTCVYRGRGDAGRWSVLAAAATSYHFLPAVILSQMLGFAHPCMGSTIALRRETFDRIGGFAPLADILADDYELGRAVRSLGLKVVVPPMLLVHGFPEASFIALWRHELRWNTTLRTVDPAGNAGMIFTHPLPFALALVPLMPRLGLVLVLGTLAARLMLKRVVDRWAGASTCPAWMLPLRDCLSVALFFAGFVSRSVDWRGSTLRMAGKGRIMAHSEFLDR